MRTMIAILVLAVTSAHASIPGGSCDPSKCYEEVACTPGGYGWSTIQCSVPSGGPVIPLAVAVNSVPPVAFSGNVRLGTGRRDVFPLTTVDAPFIAPTIPDSGRRLVFFEQTGAPGAKDAKACFVMPWSVFPAKTPPADTQVCGKLGAMRWVAVAASIGVGFEPGAPLTPDARFACYSFGNTGVSRFTADWVDPITDPTGRIGGFATPTTACLPANGSTDKPFVCFGDSRNLNPAIGPGPLWSKTPVVDLGLHVTETVDEICFNAVN